MPNGHREPYRVQRTGSPPSSVHTSDSEPTYANKMRWNVLARWVFTRWRKYKREPPDFVTVNEGEDAKGGQESKYENKKKQKKVSNKQ